MDKRGFTLIEIMLSVAAIAVIAGIGIPVYQAFQNRNEVDVAAMEFGQALRRAQAFSMASTGDSTWGVSIQSGSIVVFKGASYAARDTTYDETYDLATAIGISGTTEYVFAKMSGTPSTSGTVTVTSPNNETRSITLSAKGLVSY